jgi:hypothetical protein
VTSTDPGGNSDPEILANVLSEENLVGTVVDATIASGDIGVAGDIFGRCGKLYVERVDDLHVITDQAVISASALFRTTYPFPD